MNVRAADLVLKELGITEPQEIDLEAIAWHLGAKVKYRPLDGCEARIVGNGDRAIITVNSQSIISRQRFSIAHELGHWCYHRGKQLMCNGTESSAPGITGAMQEKVADRYAADLMLPHYVFQPIARAYPKLSFKVISELAEQFNASKTAVAIRLIQGGYFPAIVVCHGQSGRRWFTRSPDVPERWFPQKELNSESFAFDILFGNAQEDSMPRRIGADAWFGRNDALYYEIREQTIRISSQEIITLLLMEDEKMLRE